MVGRLYPEYILPGIQVGVGSFVHASFRDDPVVIEAVESVGILILPRMAVFKGGKNKRKIIGSIRESDLTRITDRTGKDHMFVYGFSDPHALVENLKIGKDDRRHPFIQAEERG